MELMPRFRRITTTIAKGIHTWNLGDKHYILTATGPDRTGIVAEVAKVILENEGNIGESKMMRMGGDFCLMMRCEIKKATEGKFLNRLGGLRALRVYCHETSVENYKKRYDYMTKDDGSFAQHIKFRLSGADNQGLLYELTDYFHKQNFRIETLHSQTQIAPFGGTLLFNVDGVVIPDDTNQEVDMISLKKDLLEIEDRLGVEISVESM